MARLIFVSELWDRAYSADGSFFGEEPSNFALLCYEDMRKSNVNKILELGCGQGRDSLFFASKGIEVTALDYSSVAIDTTRFCAKERNLPVDATMHDARKPLPLGKGEFDAVYSHMFFSMRFTRIELRFLFHEVKRVLKDKGFNFFSVRNHNDRFYRRKIAVGDGIYDVNGFQIRFFNRREVKSMVEGFQILDLREAYEDPVTLYLVSSKKS